MKRLLYIFLLLFVPVVASAGFIYSNNSAASTTIKIAMVSSEDASRSQPTGDEYVEFESKDSGFAPFLRITETASSTATYQGITLTGVK